MKLRYLYHPVRDLKPAVGFYRDVLGWEESWREGDVTAAFKIPGTEIEVMLDGSDAATPGDASGFFEVDRVDAFLEERHGRVDLADEPVDLPPIRYASFRDPSGNLIRIYQLLEEEKA